MTEQVERTVEKTEVTVRVKKAIALERGVVLPTGLRDVMRKQIIRTRPDGVMNRSDPEYWIELSHDELVSMGAKNLGEISSVTYDVTEFVEAGDIAVP